MLRSASVSNSHGVITATGLNWTKRSDSRCNRAVTCVLIISDVRATRENTAGIIKRREMELVELCGCVAVGPGGARARLESYVVKRMPCSFRRSSSCLRPYASAANTDAPVRITSIHNLHNVRDVSRSHADRQTDAIVAGHVSRYLPLPAGADFLAARA